MGSGPDLLHSAQHFESKTVRKAPLQSTHSNRKKSCYMLKSEVSIMLHCWLCSIRYTAVRIKNCLKSTSTFKIATMKNMDDFRYKGKLSCASPNRHFSLSAKMNGTQKRTLVSPKRMHCTYCGMPKGTCQAEQ